MTDGMTDEPTVPGPQEHVEVDPDAERARAARVAAAAFSAVVVAACCLYLVWIVQPGLVLADTTPTGGDMGAHVWGPAYLRDHLLPNLRLTGWTTDWYAGFPAYTFYMVVPSLLIVALDVGFIPVDSFFGFIASVALVAAAGYLAWMVRHWSSRLQQALVWLAATVLPILCIDVPYNVAFKLVAVVGIVLFPAAVWYLLKGLSLRQPGPELGAVASVMFLMDKSLFHIYGGNIASTMAGEFAFMLSITLAIFALGCFARGMATGRYRVRSAVLMASAMLCHVIPGMFFLVVGVLYLALLRPRLATLKWALPVGISGGLMSLVWYLPFLMRSDYLNDMGWEKLGVELQPQSWARSKLIGALRSVGGTVSDTLSCDLTTTAVNWSQMRRNLLPFAPHEINNVTLDDPNMWNGRIVFVLAIIGVVLSLVMVVRAGIWLTLVAATAGIGFVLMPQDRFWNARVLPFYYLAIFLLAAVGITLLLRALMLVIHGRWADPSLALSASVTGLVMVVLLFALGMTLRTNPGGKTGLPTADGKATYEWLGFRTTYQGPVRDWAKWNFEGLERKPGSTIGTDPDDPTRTIRTLDTTKSAEYFAMIDMMRGVGEERGCGRAFWEYDGGLNDYGTPMAPMLLPYFTDHCIGSMEGLYFEASSTTPFHFLVQSELSQKPSRPERFDCHLDFDTSPYSEFDLDAGIRHLQMLGVKYFMTFTDESYQAASGDERLTEVGASGPWHAFEVADVELVTPLENEPVVWTDVDDDIYSWARPAVDWFNDESKWDVLRASDGPAEWQRAAAGERVRPTPTDGEDVEVSNVRTSQDGISFEVDRTGVPVLIRTSYFPNWRAEGADGVWRVTPNFMVVTPTAERVTLTYGRTSLEMFSSLLSIVGVLMVLGFLLRPPNLLADRGREFHGDREPSADPEPGEPAGSAEPESGEPAEPGPGAPEPEPADPAPADPAPGDPEPDPDEPTTGGSVPGGADT